MIFISADVGGTFTDLVLADTDSNRHLVEKVPTSPGSAAAVLEGIRRLLERSGKQAGDVTRFIHGSTIATNAWLTRNGTRGAMLVTSGFCDVLEIGDQRRRHLYRLNDAPLPALIPRSRVIEVDERIAASGEVVVPLSDAEVERVCHAVRDAGVKSVAISLMFSHANPSHEKALADALHRRLPGHLVYCSSEINPELGEYPRANTTAAASYVGPELQRYLLSLERGLREIGFLSPLLLMRSDGGVATLESVLANPATMLLSGPAGGVVASLDLALATGLRHLVTFDMGGTSADFSLIHDRTIGTSSERIVDGQILRVPMLDIETISIGGGSIAAVDHAGGLNVGPQSAGSSPGPACFGRGGTLPTLTDALAVLGILQPGDFAGSQTTLSAQAARDAIAKQVADPLGFTVDESAHGMISVACSHMKQAIRALTVDHGHDLRDFSIAAFGGAGSIFAAFMLDDLEVSGVVVPPDAGVFSARGLLLADVRHQFQHPFYHLLDDDVAAALCEQLNALTRKADDALHRDRVAASQRRINASVDLRYVGQFHDVRVPFDIEPGTGWDLASLKERFHAFHEKLFGHCNRNGSIESVNLRLEGVGIIERYPPAAVARPAQSLPLQAGSREITVSRQGERKVCAVYDRDSLTYGHSIDGPAIIRQQDTTLYVLQGQRATVDAHLTIHIHRNGDRRV